MKHLLLTTIAFILISGCMKNDDDYITYLHNDHGIKLPPNVIHGQNQQTMFAQSTSAKYFAITSTYNSKRIVWVGKFTNNGDLVWSKELGEVFVEITNWGIACDADTAFVSYRENELVHICKLDPANGSILKTTSVIDNENIYRGRINCFQPNEIVFSAPTVISGTGYTVKTIEIFNRNLTTGYQNHNMDENAADRVGFPIITKIGYDIIDMETYINNAFTEVCVNRHTLNDDNTFSKKWEASRLTALSKLDINKVSEINLTGNTLSFSAAIGTYTPNLKVAVDIEKGTINQVKIVQ